ncbi:hypothetical protein BGE01nite_02540 [Brevifollis gellanilyticus]|uniref:Uncharacterized protein n=2 Tax=Brevifollis gellanilyticus TaxID=748831 RepID=A0A512M2K0_9BACT|nr:hypothetical protein BGE01nite_02540 [Brevifollis gellanilyticus]
MEATHVPTGISVAEHVAKDSAESKTVIQSRLLVALEAKIQRQGSHCDSDLPAHHYLKVYRGRVSLAERGISKPHPEVVDYMRRLVAAFQAMDPQAKVKLETRGSWVRFSVAATDALIAEIDFAPYQE